MIAGVDLQYLLGPGRREEFGRRLLKFFAQWARDFPDDPLIGFHVKPIEDGGALPFREIRRWPLRRPLKALLDAGPMTAQAWEDQAGCAELDWLLIPGPLDESTLLPGGAPCRIAAIVSDADLRRFTRTPRLPDASIAGRNTLSNRLQVLQNYERVFFFTDIETPPQRLSGLADKIEFSEKSGNEYNHRGYDPAVFRGQLQERIQNFPAIQSAAPAAGKAKRKLAVFTPLRPVRSGISDYSEHLLAQLADDFEITVFLDGYHPARQELFPPLRWHHAADFERWLRAGNEDAALVYVMGNNECHRNIYHWSRRAPGIMEFHDDVPLAYGMHDRNFWMNRLDWLELVEQEHGRTLEELHRNPPDDETLCDLLPMTRAFADGQRGCIVHNEWLGEQVRGNCPQLPVCNTGLGVDWPEPPHENGARRAALRAKFGVRESHALFIVIGEINPFKRFEQIFRGFSIARMACPDIILIVAGGAQDEALNRYIADGMERYGLDDGAAIRLGYLEREDFLGLIDAADAGINLRWPTLGETSATLTQLMGAGKPVLVTNRCQFKEYPDEACWKIEPGEREAERIAQAIVALARHPRHRRAIGAFAQDYIARFSWDQVAARFRDFIEQVYG